MKLLNLLKEVIELTEELKNSKTPILESIYDFTEVPIYISEENYDEAMQIREKTLFKKVGIGTFLTTVWLWRCMVEAEFLDILNTGKVVGGTFSIKVERNFGASFSGSRDDVLNWCSKNTRYQGQLYIIGINAQQKEFLNLGMEDGMEAQGLKYEVGDLIINTKIGDTGLGFSVRDVTIDDIHFIYKVDREEKELTDVTFDYI